MKNSMFFYILALLFLIPFVAKAEEWVQYTNGQNILVIADEGDFLWVGTRGGLVKLNKNNGVGTFYNNANSGLPDNDIASIAIDGSGDKWIGTYRGLAVLKDMNSPVEEPIYETMGNLKPYPNPFSQFSIINYQLSIPNNVVVKVFDVLGNEVAELVNEYQEDGVHSSLFEADNLPEGMYYYTVRTGEKVETGKLILVR